MIPGVRPQPITWQTFRGSEALHGGILTAAQLRSSNWARLGYNLYCDSRLERNHELRCRALALDLPEPAYFAGPSAAFLHGIQHAASFDDPVHLLVPTGFRLNSRKLTMVHRAEVEMEERGMHRGLPVTTPLRTCWDTIMWLDLDDAIAIIDSFLSMGTVTTAQLSGLARQRRGRRGAARASAAFSIADGGAQSPQESRLRVRLIQAGLPKPRTQVPVSVRGILLHPDMGWSEYEVAVEYDGEWHETAEQFDRDRERYSLLASAGWIIIQVTGRRMHRDFAGIVREVKQALRLRGWPA